MNFQETLRALGFQQLSVLVSGESADRNLELFVFLLNEDGATTI